MNRQAIFKTGLMGITVFAFFALAEDFDNGTIKTSLTGLGSVECGQVVQGENTNSEQDATGESVKKIWYQRVHLRLGMKAVIDERTDVSLIAETKTTYSWRQQQEFYDDLRPIYTFFPYQAEVCYTPFGPVDKPYFKLGIGIFPVKYNPDVRNLGQYLYRSGTYPPYLLNEFDYTETPLSGLRITSTLFDSLNLNFMLTSEPQQLPFNDYGVSLLCDYTFLKAITVGGGAYLSHFFSINEFYTTPEQPSNIYDIDTIYNGTDTTYQKLYYTFRGTKVMGRISVDPKVFIPLNFFGKNDLRIYSEVDFIGLKDYPKYYEQLWRRVPIMVGFNFPAFKVLDVFAIELEWFKYNFPNDYYNVLYKLNLPQPTLLSAYDWEDNQLKWSVYANKRLAKSFSLTAQVARDHMRLLRHDLKNPDLKESLRRHGDWAWMFKTAFNF